MGRDTSADAAEIINSPVTDELQHSFLEYAMSVIVSRALPDVRDGLKPVQRRILWSMHKNRLRPETSYRKSATVVGDVMAKYHPHGDAAIYDTMVRMAQPFANLVPPIDGQGNFGTLDDPAAAARYTEARMTPAAVIMTEELGEDTVDLRPNYDGKESEPAVLPAGLPYLLVNGATGIAVGLATRMAPHNLLEVVAALRHLLKHPDATLEDLMVHLPGPDLPTGGLIIDDEGGVKAAYATGRGRFRMRAVGEVTDVSARRKGVVFDQLPYEVGPEKVVARINQLLNEKKLPGVSRVLNLTDRKGTRLVVEFKTGFAPQSVLAELYRTTPLEESFSINTIALVDGRPRTLTLIELLQLYLDHRFDVVQRRTRHRLSKAEARAHIVEGLIIALDAIDEVVAIIRASKTAEAAKGKLVRTFKLSDTQATHILDMQLRRLTSMEVSSLKAELKELRARIADLADLLSSRPRQSQMISDELGAVAAKVGLPRRSRITTQVDDVSPAAPVEDEPTVVTLSASGLVGRDGAPAGRKPSRGDVLISRVATSTAAEVGVVTADGRLCRALVAGLPPVEGRSRGGQASEFFTLSGAEPVALVALSPGAPGLVLVTRRGVVKRVSGEELSATKDQAPVMTLKEPGDALVAALALPAAAGDGEAQQAVALVSSCARLLRFPLASVREQGRAAGGVAGMRLEEGSSVLAAGLVASDAQVVTVTDAGRVKVTPVLEYPEKGRGGGGVRCHKLLKGEERLALAFVGASPLAFAGSSRADLSGCAGRRDASGTLLEGGVDLVGEPR